MLKPSNDYQKIRKLEMKALNDTDAGSCTSDSDRGQKSSSKRRRTFPQRWSPTNSDEECSVQPKRRLTIATQNVELSDDDSSNDAVPFPSHRESPSPTPPRNLPPQRSQIVRASTNSRLPTPPSQRLLPLLTPPPRSASTAFTTPCHPYTAVESCMERLFTCLEEVKAEVKNNSRKIDRLLLNLESEERGHPANCTTAALPKGMNFPLENCRNLEELNARLQQEEDTRRRMICFLGNIGGTHAKDCIRRILKRLMTTSLALQYNMLGMKGKQSFCALKFVKAVVFDAVRKLFPETTEAAMAHNISSWLSSARDRDGGRQKRAEMKAICDTPKEH